MASHVQEKFANVRRRLDQLGYRQPLGIESLPLVERLFADLLHTTESLKNSKLSSHRSPREKADLESQIEPYKNDNGRLVKENNDLHMQLIRAKEDADKRIAEFKASLRKFEHENNDLKFLNNQYVHKIRAMERESKEKSDHILKLQEKNFNAVIQTPGGKKKHVPFRRQRLLLDSTLPSSDVSTAPSIPPRDDPFVADLLRVADSRIAELEREVEMTRDRNVAVEGKTATFTRQIEARDAEIERLGRVLDGGRPYDVVALEARNRSNEKLISHLNIQIDYLQQKNADLERRLEGARHGEAQARQHAADAGLEKSTLEHSLKDADRTARRLQQDKEAVIGVADRELADAKQEVTKSRTELDRCEIELSRLRNELERCAEENQTLSANLLSQTADFERLESLVDKTQQDKRKLGVRVNRLVQTEKELVSELDKYKRAKKGPAIQAARLRNRSPNRFDQLIKNLEHERDYWKGEVDRLNEIITYKRIGTGSTTVRSPSMSPIKPTRSPVRGVRSPTRTQQSQSKVRSKSADGKLEAALRTATEERDFYKNEYLSLKSELGSPKSRRSRRESPSRRADTVDGLSAADERPVAGQRLQRVVGERDELQAMLDKYEIQISEIQSSVRAVTNERDRLQDMYNDTRDELQRVRHQLSRSLPTKSPSLAAQHVLKQVEMERDESLADLRQTTIERDTLRERLQVATETQISERVAYDDKIEELHTRIRKMNSERAELEAQTDSLRSRISQLEDEVRGQAARYNEASDDYRQQRQQYNQLRLLSDEGEKSLRDTQQRLSIKEDELQVMTNRCADVESRLTDTERLASNLTSEATQLKTTITSLDREKDNLQSLLDDKTERCARLDDECAGQEDRANQLIRNNRDVARQLEHSEDALKLKDREIHSLRKQIDSLNNELSDITQARDDQIRENRLLEDDLTNMTSETQRLSTDIKDLIDERTQLSDQVQDYISEVKRVEDVLAQKEDERSQLLEQYRSLTLEAERYNAQTSQLEGETQNMRRELQSKDQHIRRLQEQVEMSDRELQQTQASHQALEGQISNQRRGMDNMDEKIRELEAERYNLEQDVTMTRDLSARLENNKDSLQRKIAAKELECERALDTVEQLEREISALKDRNHTDRQELLSLEQLLASNREKEFQSQLAVQESCSEVQLMKDRLTLNESKIDSQTREITQLRNRIMDLEQDLERSRQNITNERFEREKTAQELRRVTESSRSHVSRSGQATPSSQMLSGRATPISQSLHTPSKIFSPAASRARSPTPVRSIHSNSGAPANTSVISNNLTSSIHGYNQSSSYSASHQQSGVYQRPSSRSAADGTQPS